MDEAMVNPADRGPLSAAPERVDIRILRAVLEGGIPVARLPPMTEGGVGPAAVEVAQEDRGGPRLALMAEGEALDVLFDVGLRRDLGATWSQEGGEPI